MIPFNKPPVIGTELSYMQEAMQSGKLCGDGHFTQRCEEWMEKHFHCPKVLLRVCKIFCVNGSFVSW